jgi:nucleoside-diphosphate-sugar epimerase
MNVFMTGGSGFLGHHMAKALKGLGHEVTNYGRRICPKLENLGIVQVQGDLSSLKDHQKLDQALKGQDICFHIASKVAMWGHWQDFHNINVVGTQNLVKACKRQHVSRFIYTSTPSVVFQSSSIHGDESLPYAKNSYSLYAKSKIQAESFVLSQKSNDFHVTSLRPHMIFGPGDQNIIPGLLKAADQKRLKIIGSGDNLVDVTYVTNVVDAHLCAFSKIVEAPHTISGEAFFIGQGPVKLWDFINDVLVLYDKRPIKKKVPFSVAFSVGALFELFYKILGIFNHDPQMTRFVALQLSKDHYYNHDKAKRLLGWQPKVTLQQALTLDML